MPGKMGFTWRPLRSWRERQTAFRETKPIGLLFVVWSQGHQEKRLAASVQTRPDVRNKANSTGPEGMLTTVRKDSYARRRGLCLRRKQSQFGLPGRWRAGSTLQNDSRPLCETKPIRAAGEAAGIARPTGLFCETKPIGTGGTLRDVVAGDLESLRFRS
jgi:hypothetical protein